MSAPPFRTVKDGVFDVLKVRELLQVPTISTLPTEQPVGSLFSYQGQIAASDNTGTVTPIGGGGGGGMTSVGSGITQLASPTAIKSVAGAGGLVVTDSGTVLTFTPAAITTAGTTAGSVPLVGSGVHTIKGLVAGSGVTLTANGTGDIVVAASGSGGSPITNAGVAAGTNSLLGAAGNSVKGLVAGTGMSIANLSGNDLSLSTSGHIVDGGVAGGHISLAATGNSTVKGLVAGTNVTFSTTGTDLTINASGGGSSLTNALGTGTALILGSTVKLLAPGSNVTFDNTTDPNVIQISSLGGGGGGVTSVATVPSTGDLVASSSTIKGLIAGTNMSLTSSVTDITVTGPTFTYTGAGTSLIDPTTPTSGIFKIRGLTFLADYVASNVGNPVGAGIVGSVTAPNITLSLAGVKASSLIFGAGSAFGTLVSATPNETYHVGSVVLGPGIQMAATNSAVNSNGKRNTVVGANKNVTGWDCTVVGSGLTGPQLFTGSLITAIGSGQSCTQEVCILLGANATESTVSKILVMGGSTPGTAGVGGSTLKSSLAVADIAAGGTVVMPANANILIPIRYNGVLGFVPWYKAVASPTWTDAVPV